MIIDSDDERPPLPSKKLEEDTEEPEYESEEEEFDHTTPYKPIISQLDIPLGSAVLYLAAPNLPDECPIQSIQSIPTTLSRKIVVVVACADSSVRLISLNLQPSRKAGYSEVILDRNQRGYCHPSKGVAVTYILQRTSRTGLGIDHTEHDIQNGDLGAFGGRRTSNGSDYSSTEENLCELLIASHSSDATGVLHIWRVPLEGDKSLVTPKSQPVLPTQTQLLPNPLATMSFNPSPPSSRSHGQLLLADSHGIVRVYKALLPTGLRTPRSVSHSAGTWLATFCVPFREGDSALGKQRRLNILDARWALNGKCIVVLLENGDWGIWDIEGVGPNSERSKAAGRGLFGGGVTSFALHGFVGDELSSARSSAFAQDGVRSTLTIEASKLAPMTPKTRKVRQEALFHGPTQNTKFPGSTSGGISLLPVAKTSGGGKNDESLLFWYGYGIYSIPSLMTYWQRVSTGRPSRPPNSFQSGTLYGPSITQLTALSTSGEMITSLNQFAGRRDSNKARPGLLQHTIILSAEHRIIVLAPPITAITTSLSSKALVQPSKTSLDGHASQRVDQDMLSKQTLDLGGMDRMLDGMARGKPLFDSINSNGLTTEGRRVGFDAGY